jgi:hypothetical protein
MEPKPAGPQTVCGDPKLAVHSPRTQYTNPVRGRLAQERAHRERAEVELAGETVARHSLESEINIVNQLVQELRSSNSGIARPPEASGPAIVDAPPPWYAALGGVDHSLLPPRMVDHSLEPPLPRLDYSLQAPLPAGDFGNPLLSMPHGTRRSRARQSTERSRASRQTFNATNWRAALESGAADVAAREAAEAGTALSALGKKGRSVAGVSQLHESTEEFTMDTTTRWANFVGSTNAVDEEENSKPPPALLSFSHSFSLRDPLKDYWLIGDIEIELLVIDDTYSLPPLAGVAAGLVAPGCSYHGQRISR